MRTKPVQEEFEMSWRSLLITLCLFSILGLHCESREFRSAQMISDANRLPQRLVVIPFEQRPMTKVDTTRSQLYIEPMDADSIELTHYRGHDYYQPVNLCQVCHVLIATYVQTGEEKYLIRAERYIQKLMSLGLNSSTSLWAPYRMRYAVHSDSANTLQAPWFSGMAQGEMLTVLSRLYDLTGDAEYLEFARKVFRTLLILQGTSDRWVARIDTAGYYWIEEYPLDDRPAQTLNGFVTAVFGVYEYYLVSHDPQALEVWELSLTTLKTYLPDFHRNGQYSLYCMGHGRETNLGYHKLHISQMHDLHRLTGDSFFLIMAEVFESATQSP